MVATVTEATVFYIEVTVFHRRFYPSRSVDQNTNSSELQPDITFHSAHWFLIVVYFGIERYRDRFFLYVDMLCLAHHFPT